MDDILTTHEKLITNKISSVELVQEALKKAKDSQANLYISLLEDLALKNAKERDEACKKEGSKSYLYGIPYVLKDLFITKGIRTTAASKMLSNYIPPYDGHASKVLIEAGGVLIGKVSCDEFGMGSSNERSAFGVICHPQNNKKVAGGSSGGTAVAVAQRHVHYGLGTDTGGSSRVPACFCGIVGFKPSYGRVSRYGQIAYGSSFDQSSPMARTVLDVACVMEVLSQHDIRDPLNVNLEMKGLLDHLRTLPKDYGQGKVIGYVPSFFEGPTPHLKNVLEEALNMFKKIGFTLKEIKFKHIDYSVAAYYLLAVSEAFANLARFDGMRYGACVEHEGSIEDTYKMSRTKGLGEEVKRRILLGVHTLSQEHYERYFLKASKVRRLIYDDFVCAFQECDAIFSPVCASGVPDIGAMETNPEKMYFNDLYTVLANMAGLPAIAIPYGKDEEGLPTGFQLFGQRLKDEELLKIARSFERAII